MSINRDNTKPLIWKDSVGSGPKKIDHATCKQTLCFWNLLCYCGELGKVRVGGVWPITWRFLTFQGMPRLQDWLQVTQLMRGALGCRAQTPNSSKLKTILWTQFLGKWGDSSFFVFLFFVFGEGRRSSLTIAQGQETQDINQALPGTAEYFVHIVLLMLLIP